MLAFFVLRRYTTCCDYPVSSRRAVCPFGEGRGKQGGTVMKKYSFTLIELLVVNCDHRHFGHLGSGLGPLGGQYELWECRDAP